jgi:hypothetical protein
MGPSIKSTAVLGAAVLLLVGCSSPKLLRHYQAMEFADQAPQELELSIFPANPRAADDAPVIAGLSERAQAELIRSLASKASTTGGADELLSLVHKSSPEDAPKGCGWAVKNSVSKRVNLAVLGNLRKPADRIDKLDITLTLSSTDGNANGRPSVKRATFASWDHFDSVYGKFDIGSAKFTQSGKLSIGRTSTNTSNLPDSAGSVVKVLDLGAEADRSLEESATYGLRRLSVGGALTPTSARLVQEGGPNINLFGSSVATLSLGLTTNEDPRGVYSFALTEQGKLLKADEVKVERCQDAYPISNGEVRADVKGLALLREVTSGDGTVPEGDDEARLRWIPLKPVSTQVVLATSKDLTVERYALAHCKPGAALENCDLLFIEHNGLKNGSAEHVLLPSMDAAIELRAWLVKQAKIKTVHTLGGRAVGTTRMVAGSDVTAAHLAGLTGAQAANLRVVLYADNR